jgi:hypothetical protein
MANMAPQTAYQGSKDMKADKKPKAKAAPDRKAASRTIVGKAKTPRVVRSQAPFGGDDIGS